MYLLVLLDLDGNKLFMAFWSWDGGFKAIDKNPLRSFEVQTYKKRQSFCIVGITVITDWDE